MLVRENGEVVEEGKSILKCGSWKELIRKGDEDVLKEAGKVEIGDVVEGGVENVIWKYFCEILDQKVNLKIGDPSPDSEVRETLENEEVELNDGGNYGFENWESESESTKSDFEEDKEWESESGVWRESWVEYERWCCRVIGFLRNSGKG